MTVDGQAVDTLAILVPNPEENDQAKESDNVFTPPDGQGAFTGRIVSGVLERSNVDVGDEMRP